MDKRLKNQDCAKKKYIKELNLEASKNENYGYPIYCIVCGECCPGGLLDGKYCSEHIPHCQFCAEHGNEEARGYHVIGQRQNDWGGRNKVFNGYLCEQHAESLINWHWVD